MQRGVSDWPSSKICIYEVCVKLEFVSNLTNVSDQTHLFTTHPRVCVTGVEHVSECTERGDGVTILLKNYNPTNIFQGEKNIYQYAISKLVDLYHGSWW